MLIVDTPQGKCWEHVGNMLVNFSSPPSAAVTTRGSRPRQRHTACIVVSDEDEIGLERHTRGAKRQVTCYINCKQGGETPLHPQHPHLWCRLVVVDAARVCD